MAGLLYTPWMIQQIGKSDYGLYTLANSLISLFLIDFGLSAATARYVSKYVAEGKQDKADSFIGAVYKLYLLVDVIIFVVLIVIYFCIDIIYVKLTPEELEKFKVVYAIAAAYSVINFPFVTLNGILTAYEKFIQLKISEIVYRILVVGLTITALIFGMGLYSLVTVNAISGLIVIAYKYIVITRKTPIKPNFKSTERGLYKSIFTFSIWTTVASLAQRLVFNITPSILGIVANSAAIAVFGVITTIEGYAYTITTAINGMFMPKISRIYANDEGDIMPLMLRVGKLQFALNGLLVVGFASVGKMFIDLWMGQGYKEAYIGILLVIIPGMFFNSLQIANTAMIVKNKVKVQAVITLIMGLFNVVCSLALSKTFGVLGACVSIFLAYMLRAVLYHIAHNRVMKIDIVLFMKKCYVRMIPAVIVSLAFGIALNLIISYQGWLVLGFKGLLVSACYLGCTYVFGFTKQERGNIKSYLRRK